MDANTERQPLTFTDAQGRVWDVTVTVATIKRVRALLGVDLLEAVAGKLVDQLLRDPILLADVVYAVCKPQADAAGVSDEAFGEALAGQPIDNATEALLRAIVAFCPSPTDRKNLGQAIATTNRVLEKTRELISAKLADERMETAAMQAVEREMETAFERVMTQFGDAPESSDSTPAPSPSGS